MALRAFGQDSPQFKTVTITNWIHPGPYLRVVNGQTYNIAYSSLWGNPIGGPSATDDGDFIRYDVIPMKLQEGMTFCEMDEVIWHYNYYGHPEDEVRHFMKQIVIYNAPTNIALGTACTFKCMKVPNLISHNSFVCEAYDCGVQATNLIPVVKTISVKNN